MTKEERSWYNLCRYRTWRSQEVQRYCDNDMSAVLAVMSEFIIYHPKGIRDNKSCGKSDKIDIQTRRDLMGFIQWFGDYKRV